MQYCYCWNYDRWTWLVSILYGATEGRFTEDGFVLLAVRKRGVVW